MLKDVLKKIIEKKQKEDVDKLNINIDDNEVKIKINKVKKNEIQSSKQNTK
jgi:hypothetical protein